MYRDFTKWISYDLWKWVPFQKKQEINAYVIDWDKREGDWDKIDIAKIDGFSPLRRYEDKVFHLILKKDSKLTPIAPPFTITPGEMPGDLYEALACSAEDLEITFGLKGAPWYKSKNLPYIIILCVSLFLLFLFYFAGGKS